MGRISRIEGIVNGTISAYSHTKVMPRGLPYFVDQLLRGTVRFARKIGNNISVFNPENTYRIEVDTVQLGREIIIGPVPQWVELGSLLTIGEAKELNVVEDILTDRIVTQNRLLEVYNAGDTITLRAVPVQVFIAASKGDPSIQIKTKYPIVNGDTIDYEQTDGYLQSVASFKIQSAQTAGTTGDPEYPNLYILVTKDPLPRDFDTTTKVYLRANPAYVSPPVRIPNLISSAEPMGPAVLDYLSGRIVEGAPVIETFGLRTINRFGDYVLGTSNIYETVQKNYLLRERPWAAQTPFFWELAEGTMRFSDSRTLLRVDPVKKVFSCGLRAIPVWETPFQWRLNARANVHSWVRFLFDPYPAIEYELLAGVNTTITVNIPSGLGPIEHFEINARSDNALAEIQLTDWASVNDTVQRMEYTIVADITGISTYQATGLMVKPYFLDIDLLRARYDSNELYDGGKIWL